MHIISRTDKVNESAVISRRDYEVWNRLLLVPLSTNYYWQIAPAAAGYANIYVYVCNTLDSNFLPHRTISYGFVIFPSDTIYATIYMRH